MRQMIKKAALSLAFLSAVVSAVADEIPNRVPVKHRQLLMKQMELAINASDRYASGKIDFDADMIAQIMEIIAVDADELPGFYSPRDPDEGSATLSPQIRENLRDFTDRFGELSRIARSGGRQETAEGFRVQFAKLRASCNGCHAVYRKP